MKRKHYPSTSIQSSVPADQKPKTSPQGRRCSCGAKLSQYNPDETCGPCAQKASEEDAPVYEPDLSSGALRPCEGDSWLREGQRCGRLTRNREDGIPKCKYLHMEDRTHKAFVLRFGSSGTIDTNERTT